MLPGDPARAAHCQPHNRKGASENPERNQPLGERIVLLSVAMRWQRADRVGHSDEEPGWVEERRPAKHQWRRKG